MPRIKHHRRDESQQALPFRRKGGMWANVGVLEKRTIFALAVLIVLFSIAYVYFVMTSVMHVAGRETLSIDASKRSSEVARLEAEYLRRTESITESLAKERGFVSISSRSFVEHADSVSLYNPR
jgi:hypothetical protein